MEESEDSRDSGYRRIFRVLFQLGKVINADVPLETLLEAVAAAARELVGADNSSILLLDESRQALLLRASGGLNVTDLANISFSRGEGVAGWVVEHATPALIPDVTLDPRFKRLPGQKLQIASILCVPLVIKDGAIGAMSVTSREKNAFAREHEEFITYLGSSIVKDIENARLFRLSITDNLTKTYNRQFLCDRLQHEVERSRRYGGSLSLLMFDIDHFKKVNDTYGHAAGDFVLQQIGRITPALMREIDSVVRYGGEEFVVLMPKTGLDGATRAAERLRSEVERLELNWHEQQLHVTISCGVASFGGEIDTDEKLLHLADEMMYEAKRGGRNRVNVALPA